MTTATSSAPPATTASPKAPQAGGDDTSPNSSLVLVQRLGREHIRPYLRHLLTAMILMAVSAAATAANAWMMQPVLDDVFLNKDRAMLILVPLAVLAIAIIKGLATYGQSVIVNYAGQRVIADMQNRMYAHLMRADLAFYHGTSTGSLISRFTHDVQLLRGAVSTVLTGLAKDSLTLVFLVGLMFYQDWRLALISFLVFPVAVFPIVRIGRRLRRVSGNTQIQMGQLTTLLNQTFQGARHVKAYTMESYETARAQNLVEQLFRLVYKAARVRSASHPIMETLGGIAIAAVIWYGGLQVIEGETTPGTFFSFITALIMAYQPVKSLSNLNAWLQEGLAAADRVFKMLDVEPTITDKPGAGELTVNEGHIAFEDVHFSYNDKTSALNGVTLEVPAGKTAALVGPSGAGKSTVLNLIPRFYDIERGRLTIDGEDVRDVTLPSLRRNIALVSQEISLFDDTIRANIAYGRPDADEEDIVAAARRAAAHDFIISLPDGYDTLVGEHGIKLSGGQRQRIAIARAILKNAPILLLDEATSALDTESERQVQAALGELMKNRTTLVIAHRLSTVVDADVIFAIEEGRVAESGTHDQLLEKDGVYARLHAMQFAEDPAAINGRDTPSASDKRLKA